MSGSPNRVATKFSQELGKLAVVTCSTSGLGFEIAMALAQAGADVVVTGKHSADGHEAVGRIRPVSPNALVKFERLDLESLSSVSAFAARMAQSGRPVDLLINNACNLSLARRTDTDDGFELHLATNFLSHFALTARLLPLLRAGKEPKVIQLTSVGRHHGEIHVDDLQLRHGYTPLKAYSQSKLAMMIFAIELQRRSDLNGWGVAGNSAQPAGPRAERIANATLLTGSSTWYRRVLGFVPDASAEMRSRVSVEEAETDGDRSGKQLTDLIGPALPEALDMRVLDPVMGSKLWDVATRLTGVRWPEAQED